MGVVLDYDANTSLAMIEERNYFSLGDTVEIFGPNKVNKFKIEEIFSSDMNSIDVVRHPKEIVYIKVPMEVSKGDFMRISIDK